MCIEEERCKILQIDSRLEEILETTSYFVDRSHGNSDKKNSVDKDK